MALVFLVGCAEEPHQSPLGQPYIELSPDGAWCWFQDPRAVYVERGNKRIYFNYIDSEGQLTVADYDLETSEIRRYVIEKSWDVDDHNVGSFLVRPDNRLMFFYARHNKRGLFARISKSPGDITDWGERITISNTDRITYSHPVFLSDENRFYVFWRGEDWKPTFATSEDGEVWSDAEILIEDPSNSGNTVRPYLKVATDGKSTIHFTFTNGHPRNEEHNSIYYVKYQDNGLYKASGEFIASLRSIPIAPANADMVYDGSAPEGRAWNWDIAVDAGGAPAIVYAVFPSAREHQYRYARWVNGEWIKSELVSAGGWMPQTPFFGEERERYYSGGISLDHSNPDVVYLSREIDGTFEIEKWTTEDSGRTWSSSPVTSGSRRDNIRPVVPAGAPYVLWMRGDYVHYTDFHTSIYMVNVTQDSGRFSD